MKHFLFLLLPVLLLSSCDQYDGRNGTKTVYFPGSATPQMVSHYKNAELDGELKEFYRNGQLKMKLFYVHDKLNDSAFFYHENGQLKELQYVKDFKKEGTWKKFNQEGKMWEEIKFHNGLLNGCCTKYSYKGGKLVQRLNYKNGMKEGKQELFYNNGDPKAVLFYHDNKPLKGMMEWKENGEKINNDFKIMLREENTTAKDGKLTYFIKLENPQPHDAVYIMAGKDEESSWTAVSELEQEGDEFILGYTVPAGGTIIDTITIGAFRRTAMGNMVIQTKTIDVMAKSRR